MNEFKKFTCIAIIFWFVMPTELEWDTVIPISQRPSMWSWRPKIVARIPPRMLMSVARPFQENGMSEVVVSRVRGRHLGIELLYRTLIHARRRPGWLGLFRFNQAWIFLSNNRSIVYEWNWMNQNDTNQLNYKKLTFFFDKTKPDDEHGMASATFLHNHLVRKHMEAKKNEIS